MTNILLFLSVQEFLPDIHDVHMGGSADFLVFFGEQTRCHPCKSTFCVP